jgi:hypothetical protein
MSNRDRLIAGDNLRARPRRPAAAALFALVGRQGPINPKDRNFKLVHDGQYFAGRIAHPWRARWNRTSVQPSAAILTLK